MSTQELYSPMHRYTADVGVGGVRENRLVAGAANNTVVEAGAGSLAVVGVSKYTAPAPTPQQPISKTTVERGLALEVIYAAAAVYGDRLIPAANGEVTPIPAAPTLAQVQSIVGWCTRTQAAPGLGRALINP